MGVEELLVQELKRRLSQESTEKMKIIESKKTTKYSVEKSYGGIKAIVHKKGEDMRFYSDKGEDVTSLFKGIYSNFEDILKAITSLTTEDFIIDCEVTRDGKNMRLMVSDLMYFKEDLTNKSWNERRRFLKEMTFSDNIKLTPMVVVENSLDLKKAVSIFGKLKGCKGLNIKDYYGSYNFKGDSGWVEYSYDGKV